MNVSRAVAMTAAVLLLVGCAPQDAPKGNPTPTPPPVALVEVDQPAQVFGGDCSAMFTDDAVSEALGQSVTLMPGTVTVDPESLLVEQAGGIHCSWSRPDSTVALLVVAVPAAAVTVPEEQDCGATMISDTSCPVDVTANGIRLSGVVSADSQSAVVAPAVEALFVANANAASAGAVPAARAGAWANPVDCVHVAEAVDWVALGGTPVVFDDTMGTDAYASAVERQLRGGRVLGWCSFFSAQTNVAPTFWALGGGAWARDAVLAQNGATVVDVPGFDLVVETNGSWHTIDIFDGVNWMRVLADDTDSLYPAVTAIIDILDADA